MFYHGSNSLFGTLKRRQAWGPPGTPKEESLNVIYLSPDPAFALAIAATPEGINTINHKERTIQFENPEKFDPEKIVYVYLVDEAKIPESKMIRIDDWQIAVDVEEIIPDKVEFHKAGEILQHYSFEGGESH